MCPFPSGTSHHRGPVGKSFAAGQGAREQHIVHVAGELHHYARTLFRCRCRESAPSPRAARCAGASTTTTAAARRCFRCRRRRTAAFQRRDVDRRGIRRDILPALPHPPRRRRTPSARCIQHRVLIEVDRQILGLIAVCNRALQVGDGRRRIDPRANRFCGCSTVTPLFRYYSAINEAVEPSTIRAPPSCTNLASSVKPSKPHAAPDVVGLIDAAEIGRIVGLLVWQRRRARPGDAIDHGCGVPPMCGKMITSYCARRLPAVSFWSAKYLYGTP